MPVTELGSEAAMAPVPEVVVTVDGAAMRDWPGFHAEMARAFGFPDSYGDNLDAWIDCLSALDQPDDGLTTVHARPGGVVVLEIIAAAELPANIHRAVVDGAAFVNWRRRERGGHAVLALSFFR